MGGLSYSGERFLLNALTRLLEQDFEDFELIISDNASDKTEEICRAFAGRDRRIMRRNTTNTLAWVPIARLSSHVANSSSGSRTTTTIRRPCWVASSKRSRTAHATRALLEYRAPFGTHHCVNSGFSTWYELAMEIACALGIAGRIERVTAAELKTAAPRPRFCALSNMKLYAVGVAMPMWQSALRKHLSCVVAAQAHMQPSAAWCTPPGALLFSGQSLTPAQHIGALLLAMF